MVKQAFITIDVESDWGGRLSASNIICQGLAEGLPIILDVLGRNGCKATFFISGALAEKQAQKLRVIAEQGHEIASHGYEHNLDYSKLSDQEHLYQLQKSRQILETIFTRPIRGFRTPQFRIHPKLFKNLSLAGYTYDSSVVTGRFLSRYCFNEKYLEEARQNNINEVPVSTIPFLGLPFGLLWINAIGWTLAKIVLSYNYSKKDIVFYCHPFDLVRKKSLLPDASLAVKVWYNFNKTGAALTMDKTVGFMMKYFEVEVL